ncbi:Hect e3 ubiquitin ligase [Globisporangium polare]
MTLSLVCSSSYALRNSTASSNNSTSNSNSNSTSSSQGERTSNATGGTDTDIGAVAPSTPDPASSVGNDADGHSIALSLQVTMLFVVFLLLLCVGVCCSLQSLCRKYKCCTSVYGARDTSFDAMVSRSGSCFREDLLNDDELLRLWICWYCDFANYEMKTQCALCGNDKRQKDFSQSPGRKPSAVRPASLANAAGLSFSSATSSSTSSASSASGMLYNNATMSPPASGSSLFNPSFLIHTPLEPLPESPSTTNRSGVTLSTPPGSPPLSPTLSLTLSSEMDHSTFLNRPLQVETQQQQSHTMSFSGSRIRRKEWVTRLNEQNNQIVWTRNAMDIQASMRMSMEDGQSHLGGLHKMSVSSPSSFSSCFPSPSSSSSAEHIVLATAFVSRTVNSTSPSIKRDAANEAMQTLSQQNQSRNQQHGTIYLEPAENANVYTSLIALHAIPASLSCGVSPHAVESVRELSFPEKHRWFMQETSSILKMRWDSPSLSSDLTLHMPRDDLLRATVQGLMRTPQKLLHSPLRVQFMNEPGIDAGGIVREWFGLVVNEFLNETTGLFQCIHTSDDGIAYTINPNASIAVDEYLLHLRAFGRLLGKALLEGHLVSAPLTDVMFKHILGVPISFADLQTVDRKLAHSLQLLWETPLTDSTGAGDGTGEGDDEDGDPYALDFSIYHTAMGTVDLKPNGRNIKVTERNKKEYVTLFVQWHLANSVADEIGALVSGIYDVVPVHLLAPFDYKELRLLLCGSPKIDLNDWEEHTMVVGKKARSVMRLTTWFWRILRSLPPVQQGHILQFATGSARVPIQGFKALTASDGRLCPFTINCLPKHECPFLRAYTCFNRLDVPLYRNEKEFEQAIAMLLQMEVTGFSLQ